MDTQTVIGICTIVALVAGPVIAVSFTLWSQRREAKRGAKERLFVTLMAHRKNFPPVFEWVNALNIIDVVYAEHPKVLDNWSKCYERLQQTPDVDMAAWNRDYLDLLSSMAEILGYKHLRQTQMDKYYKPSAHGNLQQLQHDMQQNLLRVLKATTTLDAIVEPPAAKPAPTRNAFDPGKPDAGM